MKTNIVAVLGVMSIILTLILFASVFSYGYAEHYGLWFMEACMITGWLVALPAAVTGGLSYVNYQSNNSK